MRYPRYYTLSWKINKKIIESAIYLRLSEWLY